MDLKERDALGDQADKHWYYVSKARMATRHLPNSTREILDVGAGLGWFSLWLLRNGHAERAVCVDPGYETEHEERVEGGTILYRRSVTEVDADIVLMMDVLEHVDDDVALLRQYWDMAAPGTVFLITVPAFRFLWSAHDDYLEHRRRYTLSMLGDTVRAAGAEPEALHYYFGSIFPLAAVVRLTRSRRREANRSDMGRVPAAVNGLLTAILKAETQITTWNRLAGLSVVARLRKPNG